MIYPVILTNAAKADFDSIIDYVDETDGAARAGKLVLALQATWMTLTELPNRGHMVKELRSEAIARYREIHYKPYRIIYAVTNEAVVIHAILDGRRNLEALLMQRLLG